MTPTVSLLMNHEMVRRILTPFIQTCEMHFIYTPRKEPNYGKRTSCLITRATHFSSLLSQKTRSEVDEKKNVKKTS